MALLYSLSRAFDPLIPPIIMLFGSAVGIYTFVHVLLVSRKPCLAFNFQHWSNENSARLMKILGPILVMEALSVVPHVAGEADGIVIDVGSVMSQMLRMLV